MAAAGRVLNGQAPRGAGDRRILFAAGRFLEEHSLPATPPNYALAYAVVTGSDPEIGRAVVAATDGGLRLTQASATSILGESGASAVQLPADDLARTIDEARARLDQFAGIVDASRADAQAYGDALASNATGLAPSGVPDSAALAALLALTNAMIDKTHRAEEQLRATAAEMDDLRANLAVARADADTDALTGLYNRRAFEARLEEACERARTARRPVSLALCDVDHFKAINDRHGHEVGDRVLRRIAQEFERGCPGHTVGRHGGEEFILLFEGLPAADAITLLDRTRIRLAERQLTIAGTNETLSGITFSGGVVTLDGEADCRQAVHRADMALYRAKQQGRNRIEACGVA